MAGGNLKVLLVAYHFPPVNSSGVQRPLAMLKMLPRFGVDVSVLTHTYSRTDLQSDPQVLRVFDSNSEGFGKLLHYPLRVLQRISRALGAATTWHGVWSRGVKRHADQIYEIARPDVIISTYPPIETLEVGLYLSQRYGVPLVADFRDGLMFEPIEPSMLRSRRTYARYKALEQRVARQAGAIITVSDPITEYFKAEYNRDQVVTIPNGFDRDESWVEPGRGELDRSKFNLVYTGRLALSEKGRQGSAFIRALGELVRDVPAVADRLRIHFVGEFSASEKQELSTLVERGTVRLHGLVDRARSLGFQRAATMLLLIATSGKTSVATGKLFEYLNAGRPILGVTRKTAAESIILKTGAGVVVDPDDEPAIRSLLERLVLGGVAVTPRADEIEKYSRQRQMEFFATLLRTVAAGPAPSRV